MREKESDLAIKLRLEMFTDIVNEVGAENFLSAIKKAITISEHRYAVTVKKVRECAGLIEKRPPNPAVQAWAFVVDVLHKHVRRSPEGHYRLEDFVRNVDGEIVVESVPKIPESIIKAVRGVGGWQALANTIPEYLHQRMKDFCAIYEEVER